MKSETAVSEHPLPVRAVTLFTSGVSYSERAGEVDGNATVPLTFRTAQINDILKSMVLLDEGGTVQPVTYGARDPISRTLQSFAVDVTQSLSRADLLGRLRGTRIAVQTLEGGAVTGQIVAIEERQKFEDNKKVRVDVLTLLTEAGLEAVEMDAVKTIRLLDARLDREFREALSVLASGSDDQRRTVTLSFAGEGKRQVCVGYIAESPLWKMSYRLVLGEEGRTKPYLQGWALVENTTDEDWNEVRLSLVSGRPISFIQDLYQPLYLPRPVVQPDIIASPYPQIHGGDLMEAAAIGFDLPAAGGVASVRRARSQMVEDGVAAEEFPRATLERGYSTAMADDARFRESVTPRAQGQGVGELFSYEIKTPVSLPRQQASMIPVIAEDIEGEKLSIYNADVDRRFPLNAVRIINTTGLHLKGGPITVFDEGAYAGDGKMEDIPPDDSRLVSYAVDLLVEGERQYTPGTRSETAISLKRGLLTIRGLIREETLYTLKGKGQKPRTVLVEHPFDEKHTLISPAATERTASVYRFAVEVSPGGTEILRVVREQVMVVDTAILDAGFGSLLAYVGRTEPSSRLRAALEEIVDRRRRIQELSERAEASEKEIAAINEDQERIRKNMAALDRTAPLYTRYVSDLDQQETRIQTLRADAQRLRAEAAEAEQGLKAYVDELDISAL